LGNIKDIEIEQLKRENAAKDVLIASLEKRLSVYE
jgi:hypothetical protein